MQVLKMEHVKIDAGLTVKLCYDTSLDEEFKIMPLINLSNLAPQQNINFVAGTGFVTLENTSNLNWEGNVYLTFDKTAQKSEEANNTEAMLSKEKMNLLMFQLSNVLFNFSQRIDKTSANQALDALYTILNSYQELADIDFHTVDFRQHQ